MEEGNEKQFEIEIQYAKRLGVWLLLGIDS